MGKDNFNFNNKEQGNSSWQKRKSPSQLAKTERENRERKAGKMTKEDTENVPAKFKLKV